MSSDNSKSNVAPWLYESENHTIIKSVYIDGDISLQISLIKKRVDMDRVNKKFLNPKSAHPEIWNEHYFPLIIYKLKNKLTINDDPLSTDIKEDRFVRLIDDLHLDFDIKYNDRMEIIPKTKTKKFHISDSILDMRRYFERDEKTIREYIENPDYPEHPLNLYKALRYYIKQYIDCKDWIVTGMVLWVFGTYIHSIFNTYPYLYLLASRGSGKTRTLRTLSYISKLGKITINPTLASLFRIADSLSPSLFLDEVEHMKEKEKAELINFLNASFQKGTSIHRMNMDKKCLEEFEGYCPKAIASTTPIHPTLESRCLFLPIERTLNLEKYATKDPSIEHGRELNQRLGFCILDSGSELYTKYKLNELPEPYAGLLNLATPRIRQLLQPILLIASHLQIHNIEGEFENLKKFVEYQNQHAVSESVDITDQRIITALYKIVGITERSIETTTKEIIDNLELDSEREIKWFNPTRIGKVLKKYDIPNRSIGGRKRYLVNSAKITEILQRYNIAVDDIDSDKQHKVETSQGIERYENPESYTGDPSNIEDFEVDIHEEEETKE